MKAIGKILKKNADFIGFIYFLKKKILENSQKDLDLHMKLVKKLIPSLSITFILRICQLKRSLLLKMRM